MLGTAQMALDWGQRMSDTKIAEKNAGRTQDGPRNGIRGRRSPTTYGGDWSERDEPLPDPTVLLRVVSPRCLCNNGCRHVFSSEDAYDRHLEMLPNGDARCRSPEALRAFEKRPMARDAAGVWFSQVKRSS